MASAELRLLRRLSACFFFCLAAAFFTAAIGETGSWSDGQKLLSFKAKIKNAPQLLETWKPSSGPCSFAGVSCTEARVSALDLSSLLLDVDFMIVSSLLLSLERLERISLRSVGMNGSLLAAAGASCGERLAVIDLSGNRLSGSVTDIWSLGSCTNLRSLNLSGNELAISDQGTGMLHEHSPPCLQVLDLSFNNISGSAVLPWIFSNDMCAELQHLDLAVNDLSGGIAALDGAKTLLYLNLSSNKFYGEIPPQLVKDVCLSASLRVLDLSFNSFSGSLPPELASCSSLQSLNISNNNLSGEFPSDILASMMSLKKLVLSNNNFTGMLSDFVSEIGNLELLDLSSNNILGSIPKQLCQDPGKSSLKELYLQNNQFTGVIPPSLSNCSQLISLDLSFNFISGAIPNSLGSLSNLKDLIIWLNQLEGEIPSQLANIKTLENLILDNNGLTGTIPSGLRNCTNLNWISLSSNRLSGEIPPWIGELGNLAILKLGNNSFSGSIPPEIGDCHSLIWLDLNSNYLNGTIPSTLAKQSGYIAIGLVTGKRYVYLKNDGSTNCRGAGNLLEFAGIRSDQLSRVPTRRSCNFTRIYMGNTQYTFNNNGSMIFLDLSYNQLQGSIPKEIGNMFYLSVLNLGHNSLSGDIPPPLGKLKNVGILDLSHNRLEGPIPSSFSSLSMLSEIDLSNNRLNGSIPELGQLALFPDYRYVNNSGLCGFPLLPCNRTRTSSTIQAQKSHRRQASLAGSVAMGLLFSLFCIFGLIIVAIESKKRKRKESSGLREVYIDNSRSQSGTGMSWKLIGAREALSISLAAFERPLQKLTFADLLDATNQFDQENMIGKGGFGDVYRAQLKDGSVVAVKKLLHVSGQGDREFTAEMETLGRIKHRNLVPLLGYCKAREERLLVYAYMKFGSLEDVLHDGSRRKAGGVQLSWAARRKIAVGAARGLAFLHHSCIPHIIHRDMKSSNVLLDENLEARVSDFGMARVMSAVDTHLSVSTLAGTPGYVPPEYYQSFRCSTKGDVYSYGVVLLELLTGRPPTNSAEFGDSNLVGWVKQHAKLKISDVFDPKLMRDDPGLEMELLQHLKVACACLDDRPWRRPTMIQVMAMFKEIQSSGASVAAGDGSFGVELLDMDLSLKEGPH